MISEYYFWSLPQNIKESLVSRSEVHESSNVDESDSMNIDIKKKENECFPILSCLLCHVNFETRQEQLEHYNTQSHIENVRKRCNLFDDSQLDDSSDSDNEIMNDEDHDIIDNELYTITIDNYHISFYKRLIETGLYSKEYNPYMLSSLFNCSIGIFLYRSGYFTGCIYKNGVCIKHKSERRYTTRRKQGGSQNKKDKTTGKAKSMGAQLRRHNELLMREHIVDTLLQWSDLLDECSLIFLGTTKTNIGLFCNNEEDLFKKNDVRLRRIPFTYTRPTLEESHAIYSRLMTVSVSPKSIISNNDASSINIKNKVCKSSNKNDKNTDKNDMDVHELDIHTLNEIGSMLDIHFDENDLKELNISPEIMETIHESDNEETIKVISDISDDDIHNEKEIVTQQEGDTIVSVHDEDVENRQIALNTLDELYIYFDKHEEESIQSIIQSNLYLLSMWDNEGMTLLHKYTKQNDCQNVELLLKLGSNVLERDMKNKLPYHYALTKEMRTIYRQFRTKNPTLYDYKSSGIPEPITEEQEKQRKEKMKEKRLKQKQKKIEKKEEEIKLKEEDEKMRILSTMSVADHYKQANKAITSASDNNNSVQSQIQITRRVYKICSQLNLSYHRVMMYLTSQTTTEYPSILTPLTHLEELLQSGEIPANIIYEEIMSSM